MLKTQAARDALFAAIDGAAGLPPCRRNDLSLEGFDATTIAGVGWKLAMADGDVVTLNVLLGDPPEYELAANVVIMLAVEGEAGAGTDAVFEAALEALAAVLWPDGKPLAIEGVFDNLSIDDRVGRDLELIGEGGRLPLQIATISADLLLTAPTPAG